jgi:hypothetical protein
MTTHKPVSLLRDQSSRNKIVTLPRQTPHPRDDVPAGPLPEDLAAHIACFVSERTDRHDRLLDVLLAILLLAFVLSGLFFLHPFLMRPY